MRRRLSRTLLLGLLLSIVLHFTIVPLLLWLLHVNSLVPEPKEISMLVSMSKLRIERRARPTPAPARAIVKPHPVPVPIVHPQPQHVAVKAPVEHPRRREIARIDTHAPRPLPPRASSINIAQQDQVFEKTIARLRAQNDPVAGSERPVTAAAPVHSDFNIAASIGGGTHAEGLLTPVKSWHDGGYDYYYVRYWVQYADGTSETGVVPWPLRYLPSEDPFRLGIQHFPLPAPTSDYALPAGTELHPLVAYCYKHREDLDTCPIYHD